MFLNVWLWDQIPIALLPLFINFNDKNSCFESFWLLLLIPFFLFFLLTLMKAIPSLQGNVLLLEIYFQYYFMERKRVLWGSLKKEKIILSFLWMSTIFELKSWLGSDKYLNFLNRKMELGSVKVEKMEETLLWNFLVGSKLAMSWGPKQKWKVPHLIFGIVFNFE